ncbi:Aste57867_1901 [Aphanomyces stellatus]|uniref:Aste57867_1901 protein n=1 Tax=Aphanomyces stellatus TaxID=120398 RepID=A0A485K9U7_9STRA|nr:hypothetical protein As57867_001899 [Aphanomyces stellatus]VFT79108.1 Aste57867_1901 [Aphanomyces stellatus]
MTLLRCLFTLAIAPLVVHAAPTISLKTTDRVVVVGAGPAGVHYASLLAKKGLTKIQLIDANDHVGGKSSTIWDDDGVPHEMGTVFALDSYTPIFDLLDAYDPTNTRFPFAFERPKYMATMGESAGADDSDPTTTLDFPGYVLRTIQANAPPALRANATKAQLHALFADQAQRYIAVHRSIFGIYPYGMPPPPTNWSLIDMTAIEFLKANNLTALTGLFRFSQQQQGYGVLETIPAFYFLWWSHPATVAKIIRAQVQYHSCAYELSKGFQSLWMQIAAAHAPAVTTILNARVLRVDRGSTPSVTYFDRRAWAPVTIECDHIVMALDLSVNANVVVDMTANEKALFLGSYTASTYIATLFRSNPSPVETATQIWPDRVRQSGRVSAIRNSRLTVVEGNDDDDVGASQDVSALIVGRQVRVAYQFYDKPRKDVDHDHATDTFWKDLAKAGMDRGGVWAQTYWNYFPRFTRDGLKQGLPWKIWDIQGDRHTTWIGSSVSFESVLDVVTYNNNLIQRVQVATGP